MASGGFFARLRERLGKTRTSLVGGVRRIFAGRDRLDEGVYQELEETLIEADLGVETTLQIVADMRRLVRERGLATPDELYALLKDEMVRLMEGDGRAVTWEAAEGPHVTLIAGVNGSGKTTTAGKLAQKLRERGHSVLLGAADTFRAAACAQLSVWAERTGAEIVREKEGADPAAVAYASVDAAVARGVDNVLIDTAGRLHTKVNLMEELKKIQRVVGRRLPGAPHEVLLVLDATTGQNGLQQAKIFTEALEVTGVVLTKLDGTARGGMAVAIQKQLGIPIVMIGVGESAEDLQPFDARQFIEALFGEGRDEV
ncbi:MAG TPA: signal recognition particle-docking protein FtsY [Candidatus Hydrogenedentes bacterium]|nr:signal recognition particle-docking protein FtsY [Candidatus Hydrogenedentota bacterium]HOC72127.1 signal recognition particle-docking protein FtsY [Candidatus Hydrogenedentota bacterium]HOH49576.1 signal recognition particle-docking protein FtsY [Candidatus Hydrogenedentota bacterium]HPA41421.1 signal recognition particle-docking protein FtsY [Candidatus Hydrogenedentota bacterium]HQL94087.1 signal recognition particle-docking protein FtsY [Candidatus Hydrogenedentota bacterium]